MAIGLLDLLLIYTLPLVILGGALGAFLVGLYIVVKRDIGHLDLSEDIRFNIQLRKRPVTFGSLVQVFLFEPGVQAAFCYRVARYLHFHGLRPVASVIHKLSRVWTNVDLPPTARVGPGVVFLHCANITVGPYADIGKRVIFRPAVNLRGWGTVKLEDDVRTGLQTVVMDCVTMGKNSESSPGSIITQDVPANHFAIETPVKRMIFPKPETKLRLVVIELEHVLMEPTDVGREALDRVFGQNGMGPVKGGKGAALLPLERLIQERTRGLGIGHEEVLQQYVDAVRQAMAASVRLKAGARDLVDKLRERGLKVALISSQPDLLCREMVEHLGLRESVDFTCGADECLWEWKPQPWIVYRPMRELKLGVERVIYVAGTPLDKRTGIEAAVRVFWIAGPDGAEVSSMGLVNKFQDLDGVLEAFSAPQLPQTL